MWKVTSFQCLKVPRIFGKDRDIRIVQFLGGVSDILSDPLAGESTNAESYKMHKT